MTSNNKYFLWADATRVIAIYLVLVVHSSSLILSNWFSLFIFAVAKLCVPLFVILSGSLLLSKKETYLEFFKKRFIKVLFPWIVWTFIYIAWEFFYFHIHINSVSQAKYLFESIFLTRFWFLPMIFGLYLLTPFFRHFISIAKKKDTFYIFILWFVVFSLLPYFHDSLAFPLSTDNSLALQVIKYSGFYLIGNFLMQVKVSKKMLIFYFSLVILSLLWIVILTLHSSNSKVLDYKYYDYVSPGIIVGSICFFIFIKTFFENREKYIKKFVKNTIIVLSKASFGILLFHQILLDAYGLDLYNFFSKSLHVDAAFIGVTKGITVFAICFIVVNMLQKIPIVRKIVA